MWIVNWLNLIECANLVQGHAILFYEELKHETELLRLEGASLK